jgi:hypothetical protein
MPDNLIAEQFATSHINELADFHCGDAEWEKEVAEWIVGTGTAEPKLAVLLTAGQTEAWVYRNTAGIIVGYAALTKLRWNVDGDRIKTTLLQACGIRSEFQGKPDGDGETKYSQQIMADVAGRAIGYQRPLFALFVHKDNLKAQRLYKSCGFIKIEEPRDKYYRMFVDLTEELESASRKPPSTQS